MNFDKTIGLLGSRIALNVYFWLVLFLLKYPDADDQHAFPGIVYYGFMIFFMAFFAVLTYTNNLLLLPKLWFSKKRLLYAGAALLLLLSVSTLYVICLKVLPGIFPGLNTQQTSLIQYPISDVLSFAALREDVPPYMFVMSVWLFAFSVLGSFHYKHERNKQKIKNMEEAINKHRDAELAFLKSQVNPHFLFNTLNNLYALSQKKSEQTSESIIKLATVLRYILYESNAELVPYATEKDIMQAYIDIELLRIENSPHLNFSITADGDYQIPPLIWLPLLENLFKHTRMVEQLEVDFRFVIHSGKLSVYCRNNTVTIPHHEEKNEGGIGLVNLKKRLELLYPEKHVLETRTEGAYFLTEVQFALN